MCPQIILGIMNFRYVHQVLLQYIKDIVCVVCLTSNNVKSLQSQYLSIKEQTVTGNVL